MRDRRAPAQEDSETSVDAAIAIQVRVGAIDHQVLARIRQSPCTAQEGQDSTGIDGNTWRPAQRRPELAGSILPDGTRPTRSGRQAVVWRAARAGEPPGTRQRPGAESGAQRQAVARGDRQGDRTAAAVDVGALWVQVWDAKPAWMTTPKHRQLVNEALEQHPGDTGAGLQQALRDLTELGGGR